MTTDRITVISDVIAEQIRAHRKRQGMTREEFAAEARAAGAPESMSAAVVGYIETGRRGRDGQRRREVTVDELVMLARATGTTPLALLGEHAPAFGGDEPPECPRCAAGTGSVQAKVRAEVAELGALTGVDGSLAEVCYALAAAIDAGGGDDGRQIPTLAKELRATLKALVEAKTPPPAPTVEEEDPLSDLGSPD